MNFPNSSMVAIPISRSRKIKLNHIPALSVLKHLQCETENSRNLHCTNTCLAWEDLNWILEENRGRHTAASDRMNSLFKSLGDRE